MACRNAYTMMTTITEKAENKIQPVTAEKTVTRLLFGIDTKIETDDLLQNNITQFEWAVRNKIYPNFVGRYIEGENSLNKDEIKFIHRKGCKIATIYVDNGEKQTEEQGKLLAKKIDIRALELGIPEGVAIFLEIGEKENVTRNFMLGFAKMMIAQGYTPAFKANTDAKFSFDREFSRGMQTNKDVFDKCLIWAVAPTLAEYDGITTTHLIHPDNWTPYAPSGITRADIAIWQYGKECHPIEDDKGKLVTFNLNLVRNGQVIIDKML